MERVFISNIGAQDAWFHKRHLFYGKEMILIGENLFIFANESDKPEILKDYGDFYFFDVTYQ